MEFYYKKELVQLKRLCQFYTLLETNRFDLRQVIAYPEYRSFTISKKNGGSRSIDAPGFKLKAIQSRLNEILSDYYNTIKPDSVHGFIHKTAPKAIWNTKSNASAHVRRNFVLNIDLKDFFHSITSDQVKAMFMKPLFNCDEALSAALALICCYQRKLPMGAPTSPVISNLYCYEMDVELIRYCSEADITFTRYADDLTFSSNQAITEDVISVVRSIINDHNLTINEAKFRMQSKFGKQWVTGLKVNEKVNVDRKYKRNIRAMKYDIQKNGNEEAARKHYRIIPGAAISDILVKKFIACVKGKQGYIWWIES